MSAGVDLFHCQRQNMRLTAAGCARLWRSAQDKGNAPKPWEGRLACVTCPFGAANAGVKVSPVVESVAILSKVCSRCLRLSDRIIEGRLCISCYNRQAEADRGRNAKGGTPRLCAILHDMDVAVFSGEGIEITHAGPVLGAAEVIVAFARRAEAITSFGWVAAGPGNIEGIMA